jgi:hypothetical protein
MKTLLIALAAGRSAATDHHGPVYHGGPPAIRPVTKL